MKCSSHVIHDVTGGVTLGHLIEVVSATFLSCEVTIFPFHTLFFWEASHHFQPIKHFEYEHLVLLENIGQKVQCIHYHLQMRKESKDTSMILNS